MAEGTVKWFNEKKAMVLLSKMMVRIFSSTTLVSMDPGSKPCMKARESDLRSRQAQKAPRLRT